MKKLLQPRTIMRRLIAALEDRMRYGAPAYSRSGKHCLGCDSYNSYSETPKHERGCETARLEKLIASAKIYLRPGQQSREKKGNIRAPELEASRGVENVLFPRRAAPLKVFEEMDAVTRRVIEAYRPGQQSKDRP